MNKSALRKFAIEARLELREKVKMKALQIGITEDSIKKETVEGSDSVFIEGKQLSKKEQAQRNKLIERISLKGFNQVIEEVAYTWFNRFTALRFMEIHNYLPTKVRVLSSIHEGSYEPDIIKEALNINLDIDKEYVYNLKLSIENDATDKLYKHLILSQCNALAPILPFMFGKTDDYTIILFPDGLLSEGSFLRRMTNTDIIPESDWDDVEIIGWLYQYYIAEENDRVIKAKKRYKKEEIPFATQLFTPDWIVRYMVQNALGRYWVESHPEDRDLINNWEFYLENPNPEPDFEEKLEPYLNKDMKVEDIKCFDPAMGSGHILVYMFDVLYEIYSKCGYMEREIPKLIIENNLYGLDIDDRAYQLACFSVIMKAQQYNSRFLRKLERQVRDTGEYINLNLASIQETNELGDKEIEYIAGESSGEKFDKVKRFINQFENAKIYGSLTEVEEFDEEFISKRAEEVINNPVEDITLQSAKKKVDNILENLIRQARIMSQTYDVLVTNPPYMGSGYLTPLLSEYLKNNFKDYKFDIYSSFVAKGIELVNENGTIAFLTPYSWMFNKSYKYLRVKLIDESYITSLIQLEYNAFPEACVPVCTFTLRKTNTDLTGEYIKLSEFKGALNQPIKTIEAIKNPHVEYRYSTSVQEYQNIPGKPIAYWISQNLIKTFRNKNISYYGYIGKGLDTCDKDRFERSWVEVNKEKISFETDLSNKNSISKKWYPFSKGGGFRKWYGNYWDIVNWENDGNELRNFRNENGKLKSRPQNTDKYFKEAITWSSISSSYFGARLLRNAVYGNGASLFLKDKYKEYENFFLSFLCSTVNLEYLKFFSPGLSFNAGDLMKVPIILPNKELLLKINELTNYCIEVSYEDWNLRETSWDFNTSPLIKMNSENKVKLIQEVIGKYSSRWKSKYCNLHKAEEELNKIYCQLYNMSEEISYKLPLEEVTIMKEESKIENNEIFFKQDIIIKQFISYAVGCMFGRYSLDEEGLIYAGGEFDLDKYKTFEADKDNILPIVDDAYFEDDIVSKFIDFVEITFSSETLNENLEFIADTLGMKKNETPKETIRRYFINNFYKDHVKTYKKRPIYWLFSSGKQKAFNALIYMHRYDSSTLARIRTDYLHVLQTRLESQRHSLIEIVDSDESVKEKKRAEKKLKNIDKQIAELKEYDEVLHHMADQQIEIDLDDGVKVNYEKFKDLVAKI